MSTGQLMKKAFLLLARQAPAGKKVAVVVTQDGAEANAELVDITITSAQQAQLEAKPDSDWANTFSSIGLGGVLGQRGISSDYKWRYECWGDNNWTRDKIISITFETYIGSIDDSVSVGAATGEDLDAAFPTAVQGQVVEGSDGYYTKKAARWVYVNYGAPDVNPLLPKTVSANYTLTSDDHNKVISVDSETDVTISVPIMPAGFRFTLSQVNTGKATLSPNGAGMGIFAWPKTGVSGTADQWDTIDVVTPNGKQFILK